MTGKKNHKIASYPIKIRHGEPAVTLKGELTDYSSEVLHCHDCHQYLVIKNGISLLIDKKMKQPLYGKLCAFLPAGYPHRTVVTGESITYQSLYLKREVLPEPPVEIIIYPISELGIALFNRMALAARVSLNTGIMKEILSLFLKISSDEMKSRELSLALPEPVSSECRKLTEFMEANFRKGISMEQLRSVLPYSTRHISRIFSAEMKMTPFDYLRAYRMIMASVMLQERSKSVLEVSLDSGYESLSSFYSDFNRFFSGRPGDFRRSLTG